MKAEQWRTLQDCARKVETTRVPLALIVDSPWIPGYLGISTASLAADVGIRRPSLYHHFPDGKEQLFIEVALRMIDTNARRVAEALAVPGGLRAQLVALAMLHATDPRRSALEQRIYDATRHVSDETRTLVSSRYVEINATHGWMAIVAHLDVVGLQIWLCTWLADSPIRRASLPVSILVGRCALLICDFPAEPAPFLDGQRQRVPVQCLTQRHYWGHEAYVAQHTTRRPGCADRPGLRQINQMVGEGQHALETVLDQHDRQP